MVLINSFSNEVHLSKVENNWAKKSPDHFSETNVNQAIHTYL